MDQEYTVVSKSKRRRSRRKVSPIIVEDAHYERADSTSSNISLNSKDEKDNYYTFGDPEVIQKCIQNRWKNDIDYAEKVNEKLMSRTPPPGLTSPVRFFENSKTARLFQIAQQHPQEYIPVPSMKPYMVPLYPDKEFYNGHGFIPSQFLMTKQ